MWLIEMLRGWRRLPTGNPPASARTAVLEGVDRRNLQKKTGKSTREGGACRKPTTGWAPREPG